MLMWLAWQRASTVRPENMSRPRVLAMRRAALTVLRGRMSRAPAASSSQTARCASRASILRQPAGPSRATVSTLSRHLQFGRPSGNLYNSWPTPHYHVLKTYGHQILDFQFSGYLFFGNVVDLLKRIESFIAQSYIEAKYNDNENANKCDALRSGDNPYKYYSSEKKKMRKTWQMHRPTKIFEHGTRGNGSRFCMHSIFVWFDLQKEG